MGRHASVVIGARRRDGERVDVADGHRERQG
jgi:hypothetical protein